MSERDESRHLAVVAGAPADRDPVADGPVAADGPPVPAVDQDGQPGSEVPSPSPGDAVQAVAEFVEDLVDDAATGDGDGT